MKAQQFDIPYAPGAICRVRIIPVAPPIALVTQTDPAVLAIRNAHDEIRRAVAKRLGRDDFIFVEHMPHVADVDDKVRFVFSSGPLPEWL